MVSFRFSANNANMLGSCAQWGVPNNSQDEINEMGSAIQSVASSTGVDARFIFAVVMQESNGCVRAPTTNYGVTNPGLMQSHNGAGSCNNGGVQNPCPSSEITQMIEDGTAGTSSGDGLQQLLAQAPGSGVTKYYQAARMYNSGSIDPSGNLGAGIATHCYVSDIANRLLGWTSGSSGCDPNTIGSLTSSGSFTSGGGGSSGSTPPPTTTPPPSSGGGGSGPASGVPVYSGATSSCQEYYTVVSGDYCAKVESQFGISADQLMSWNSGLDSSCSNLWLGYQYCVKA